VKRANALRLRELSAQKTGDFRRRFLGEEVEVILEASEASCQNGAKTESAWTGFSENYLPVAVTTSAGFRGKLVRCRLEHQAGGMLAGKDYAGREEASQGVRA
jgi:tRNA A37 methylthiotransferase MiaB